MGALLLQILAGVLRQIAISLGITALLTTLQNVLTSPNPAPSLPWWQADVKQLDDLLAYPGANFHPSSASVAVILDALFAMALDYQQRGHDVTLPSTPPSGYGGLSGSATGDAVWLYPNPDFSGTMAFTVDQMRFDIEDLHGMGGLAGNSPHGILAWEGNQFGPFAQFADHLHAPLADVGPTDTVLSWLSRNNAGATFTLQTDGSLSYFPAPPHDGSPGLQVLWSDAYMHAMAAGFGGAAGAPVPPVWPGLAAVTLGTPVALVDGLVISTPMDGVIVDLTAAPSGKVVHLLGGLPAFRWIGSLSFEDDNGDQESVQQLSFAHQVYTPRALKAAAGVRFYVLGGVTGTVTPWTIT